MTYYGTQKGLQTKWWGLALNHSPVVSKVALDGQNYCLELTMCDVFLPRRLNLTVQYFLAFVRNDEKTCWVILMLHA